MAWAEKRGDGYRVRYRLPDGSLFTENGFDTREEAETGRRTWSPISDGDGSSIPGWGRPGSATGCRSGCRPTTSAQ